jgi:hypothetical protein
MDASISVALVFSVVAAAGTLYSIWNQHKKNVAEEERKARAQAENFVKLDVKMDSVLGTTGSILNKQEQYGIKLEHLSGELIKTNERIETLFHYKDDHETRLKELEKK